MSTPPRRHSAEYAQNALRRSTDRLGAYGRTALGWMEHELPEQLDRFIGSPWQVTFAAIVAPVMICFAWVTAIALGLGNYANAISLLALSVGTMQRVRNHRSNMAHHEGHRASLEDLQHEVAELRRVLVTQADTAEIPAVSNVVQMPDPATHKARRARSTRTGGRKRGDVNESE